MTPAATRKRLLTLLRHDDPGHIRQGVALALSLRDPALVADLLRGTTLRALSPTEAETPFGDTRIEPPAMLTAHARYSTPRDQYAVLCLVIASDHPSARRLRARLRVLDWNHLAFPFDLSKLTALRALHFYRHHAPGLAAQLGALPALEHFASSDALPLDALRSATLSTLSIVCDHAARFTPGALPALTQLSLSFEHALPELSILRDVPALRALDLHHSPTLCALDGVEHLRDLTALRVSECPIPSLEPLRSLRALRTLTLYKCPVEDLTALAALPALRALSLSGLPIRSLEGAEHLSLDAFALHDCPALASLAAMPTVTPTEGQLLMTGLHVLRALDGIERSLPALTFLFLSGMPLLHTLDALRGATQLESLKIQGVSAIETLRGLEGCAALTSLEFTDAPALRDVSALRALPSLRRVVLSRATALTDVTALATLPSLEALDLRGAADLSDIAALAACPRLKTVALHGTAVRRYTVPSRLRAKCTWATNPRPARLQ